MAYLLWIVHLFPPFKSGVLGKGVRTGGED